VRFQEITDRFFSDSPSVDDLILALAGAYWSQVQERVKAGLGPVA